MKGGRPKNSTKLNSEIIAQLRHHLITGKTIKLSCREAGVSYPSFYRWRLKANKAQRGIFREFHKAIDPIFKEKEEFLEDKRQEWLARDNERFLKRKAREEKLLHKQRSRGF